MRCRMQSASAMCNGDSLGAQSVVHTVNAHQDDQRQANLALRGRETHHIDLRPEA